jgi:hypothetical protein
MWSPAGKRYMNLGIHPLQPLDPLTEWRSKDRPIVGARLWRHREQQGLRNNRAEHRHGDHCHEACHVPLRSIVIDDRVGSSLRDPCR